jgi:hypothetical protein
MAVIDYPSSQQFFHGTRAELKPGDRIETGRSCNYGKRKEAAYVYLTASLDAATWGAELAMGRAGSISWSRPDRLKMIPILRTRSSQVIRRRPTALGTRYWSRARSRTGKDTPPNSSRP